MCGRSFCGLIPKTTSYVVMVQPEGDQHVQKIVRELKLSRSSPSVIMLESENGVEGNSTGKMNQNWNQSDPDQDLYQFTVWSDTEL